MKPAALVAASVAVLIPHLAGAQESPPAWITPEKLAVLTTLGIDPVDDVVTRANYHWKWRSRHDLAIGGYQCPAGSTVSISRNLVVITAPEETPCLGPKVGPVHLVKVLPDGSAEPLGGGD